MLARIFLPWPRSAQKIICVGNSAGKDAWRQLQKKGGEKTGAADNLSSRELREGKKPSPSVFPHLGGNASTICPGGREVGKKKRGPCGEGCAHGGSIRSGGKKDPFRHHKGRENHLVFPIKRGGNNHRPPTLSCERVLFVKKKNK